MKKDYIEIGGKTYRVESNWNALIAFLCAVGRDDITQLTKIKSIRPSEIMPLMAACIAEGERLDGKEGSPTAMDLGAVATPEDVREFMSIYARQSEPKVNVEQPKKEERETEPAR